MSDTLTCLEAADLPADAIEVGRIADAWGIKGFFKVIPYSASPEALFSSKRWYLLPPEPRPGVVLSSKDAAFTSCQLIKVRSAKEHTDVIVVQIDGCDDRNTAELLKSARIFIARSAFPTAASDEFYWVDLMGLAVVNREGLALGVVKDLISTGPQTVMVIEAEADGKKRETLIPFVSVYVDDVSLENKRITVDWQSDYSD
jgi:16S rRNA processing protein RimM